MTDVAVYDVENDKQVGISVITMIQFIQFNVVSRSLNENPLTMISQYQ
jgi:hypothetical protein